MKFNTFYEIYYSHRVKKSSFLLKLYIFITLPINYLINKIKLQSIINLDNFANKNQNLFEKDLKFLFEFFNSDKGEKFINQYLKPIKLKNNLIDRLTITHKKLNNINILSSYFNIIIMDF